MELNPALQGKEIDGGANAAYWDTVRRRGHANPEQDLMLAVLKDALLNYRKNLRTRNRLFKDDRLWFFAGETDRLFSFESVCAELGLDSKKYANDYWRGKRKPETLCCSTKFRRLSKPRIRNHRRNV